MLVAVSVQSPPWLALGVYGRWPSQLGRAKRVRLEERRPACNHSPSSAMYTAPKFLYNF